MDQPVKIDTAKGMEYSMDDADMYADMAQMFIDQEAENTAMINGFFAKKDWENYKIRVHGLKSSSRLVGGMQLGDLAEKCEHAARDGDIAFIEANTAALMELYSLTVMALQKVDFKAL